MDSEEKRIINSLILELRALMEEELELVLKHYGIFLKRNWLDIEQLDFLSDEEKETKKKLEISIKRKEKIGIKTEESIREFITEAAYHWLNRIFGLKCLESRDLIEEIITTRSDYSGRSLIHRNYLDAHPELKKSEDEGYFQCFYEFLSKLTAEIQIIFDPNDIHMLIKPRITALKEIIKKINNLDEEIYQNDEFLGWIYQYFHDKEREKIYKRIKKEKLKIGGSNLIPITQLYTEDYMVRFLSQNSLGSIWMEMYPKSQLYKNWEYYVESPNNAMREVKDLSSIKILDPACGSGHFLLYLFDMLYDMYVEEGKVAVKDIPNEIIENNLYGIDIDTRAIQIAALTLYIKYKEKLVDETVEIPNFNLFSSDIISYKTEILNDFLNEFENNKFFKKIIVTIWANLEDIREIGSLSQVDQIINRLIDEEIDNNRKNLLQFTESRIENWHSFRTKIINRLRNFLQEAIQTFDINKELFAKDEEKGVWLIEVFENKYDLVITNPPYLGSNKLNNNLKKKFKRLYPMSYRDLCNMFINRIPDFLNSNGYAAIVTMQSFMFIDIYKEFRKFLLNNIRIRKLIHLGKYAFFDNTGAVLQTILFIFQPKNNNIILNKSIYYNLQKFSTTKEKIQNLIKPLYKFEVDQNDFKLIQNYPFIYWISDNIRNIFRNNPNLKGIAPAKAGLQTGENEKFLRFWWEVKKNKISNYNSNEKKKWFFYAKGGIFNRWFGNLDIVVNWENNGEEISKHSSSVRRNEDYYFNEGITYTLISGGKFSARILPKNCLFDVNGSSSFLIEGHNIYYLLGYLNSRLIGYFLNFLNPTVATQVGDINRLPYIEPNADIKNKVSELVEKAIDTKKELLSFNLIEWNFNITGLELGISNNSGSLNLETLYLNFIRYREKLILELLLIEGIVDEEIFLLFDLSEEEKKEIYNDQGYSPHYFPIIKLFDKTFNSIDNKVSDFYKNIQIIEYSSRDLDKIGEKIENLYMQDKTSQILENITYISLELHLNPLTVYNIIKELNLINKSEFINEIENFLTRIIIDTLRDEEKGIILLNEPSDNKILFRRVLTKFDYYFGEENTDNILKQINNLFGKSIDEWIQKDFFKKHISQFKKRPIIWHLSSEEKSFQCFIDYHKLSQNLLIILRNRYIQKRLMFLKEESKNLTESLINESNDSRIKELNSVYIEIEDSIEDLQKFSENLKKIIDLNIEFDEDNGVKQQILPFQKNKLLSINKVV